MQSTPHLYFVTFPRYMHNSFMYKNYVLGKEDRRTSTNKRTQHGLFNVFSKGLGIAYLLPPTDTKVRFLLRGKSPRNHMAGMGHYGYMLVEDPALLGIRHYSPMSPYLKIVAKVEIDENLFCILPTEIRKCGAVGGVHLLLPATSSYFQPSDSVAISESLSPLPLRKVYTQLKRKHKAKMREHFLPMALAAVE